MISRRKLRTRSIRSWSRDTDQTLQGKLCHFNFELLDILNLKIILPESRIFVLNVRLFSFAKNDATNYICVVYLKLCSHYIHIILLKILLQEISVVMHNDL